MLALHDLVGPFKAVGNYLGRKTVGPFVNVDTAFPCSGGPIQSSRKLSREENSGPIRKHRYRLSMIWWALSKQSETISTGPIREH
jgi:hypothetical protein